jgi:hypothetical protein
MDVIYNELTIKNDWFQFTKESTDGRINSIKDEDIILDWLFGLPSLHGRISRKKCVRDIADFWIDETIPVNIKVSMDKRSQFNNVSSVPGLFSHCMNQQAKSNTDVAKCINEIYAHGFLSVNTQPYCLLIVCKTRKKFWIGNFDELSSDDVYMNPSNGFQVRSIPDDYVSRNNTQFVFFFLKKVNEYYKKIAEPYLITQGFLDT